MTARENAETADLTLEVERLRVELSASQGMRESLGAMLKLANDNTAREMAKVQSLAAQLAGARMEQDRIQKLWKDDEAKGMARETRLEQQLAEATGLLLEVEEEQRTDWYSRRDAFLSRAPAQAAELGVSAETMVKAIRGWAFCEHLTPHQRWERIAALLAPSQGEGGGGK